MTRMTEAQEMVLKLDWRMQDIVVQLVPASLKEKERPDKQKQTDGFINRPTNISGTN